MYGWCEGRNESAAHGKFEVYQIQKSQSKNIRVTVKKKNSFAYYKFLN